MKVITDTNMLITGTSLGMMYVWDQTSGECIDTVVVFPQQGESKNGINSLEFIQKNNRNQFETDVLITADMGGYLKVWKRVLEPTKIVEGKENHTGCKLTLFI